MNGTTTTIKGDFNLESTGTGTGIMTFKNTANNTATTLNVLGDFNVTDGRMNFTAAGVLTIDIAGDYNQEVGTVYIAGAAGRTSTLTVNGDFNLKSGIFDIYGYNSTSYYAQLILYGHYNQTGGTCRSTYVGNGTNTKIVFRGANKNYIQNGGSTVVSTNIHYDLNFANASLNLLNGITIASGRSFLSKMEFCIWVQIPLPELVHLRLLIPPAPASV